jgi:hypothetical protein
LWNDIACSNNRHHSSAQCLNKNMEAQRSNELLTPESSAKLRGSSRTLSLYSRFSGSHSTLIEIQRDASMSYPQTHNPLSSCFQVQCLTQLQPPLNKEKFM